MTADGTGPETGDVETDTRAIPVEDDRGKRVVDRQQREVGLVSRVEGDTIYVKPEPSIADRIVAALAMDEMRGDGLPVPPEFVESIDDVVVLEVERDDEFHERAS